MIVVVSMIVVLVVVIVEETNRQEDIQYSFLHDQNNSLWETNENFLYDLNSILI